MFDFSELFKWERFITPDIIKTFYKWIAAFIVLSGLSGILSGIGLLFTNPIIGLVTVVMSVLGIVVGVIFARIAAEVVLIIFRISEHLGAIRARGEM